MSPSLVVKSVRCCFRQDSGGQTRRCWPMHWEKLQRYLDSTLCSITTTSNVVVMAKQLQQETTQLVHWLVGAHSFCISGPCIGLVYLQKIDQTNKPRLDLVKTGNAKLASSIPPTTPPHHSLSWSHGGFCFPVILNLVDVTTSLGEYSRIIWSRRVFALCRQARKTWLTVSQIKGALQNLMTKKTKVTK